MLVSQNTYLLFLNKTYSLVTMLDHKNIVLSCYWYLSSQKQIESLFKLRVSDSGTAEIFRRRGQNYETGKSQ